MSYYRTAMDLEGKYDDDLSPESHSARQLSIWQLFLVTNFDCRNTFCLILLTGNTIYPLALSENFDTLLPCGSICTVYKGMHLKSHIGLL